MGLVKEIKHAKIELDTTLCMIGAMYAADHGYTLTVWAFLLNIAYVVYITAREKMTHVSQLTHCRKLKNEGR